jgi:hypothetical protein
MELIKCTNFWIRVDVKIVFGPYMHNGDNVLVLIDGIRSIVGAYIKHQ